MYRGKAKALLKGIDIGDRIEVSKDYKSFEGVLMPRNELADDRHVVIKLDSGYNIGIEVDDVRIELIEKAKPAIVSKPEKMKDNPDLPNITVLGTGGTIASKIDYKTGAVAPAFSAEELHAAVPELSSVANIRTRMLFNILSENMGPDEWTATAQAVVEELNGGSDGVVIAHGTDTMGYTSAALCFILRDLEKPVVLVGSQRSSDRPSSDSAVNILSAVRVAVSDAAGVYVVMHGSIRDDTCLIHHGAKVRKLHSSRRDAFRSINIPAAGRVGESVEFYGKVRGRGDARVRLNGRFEQSVALVKMHPGIQKELMDFYAENYKGIVIEGTGLGHIPERLLPTIKKAKEKGVPIVMTTQTLYGRVDMKVYSTGRHLLSHGVMPGGDMLPETACVKLMWVLGMTADPDEVAELMTSNIAGELSDVSRPDAFLG